MNGENFRKENLMDHLTTLGGIYLPTSLQTEENKKESNTYNKKTCYRYMEKYFICFFFFGMK